MATNRKKNIKELLPMVAILVFVLFSLSIPVLAQETKQTPAAGEGPYWKPGSPKRDMLYRKNDPGEKILVTGRVIDLSGKPIPEAKIDIWQTDAKGHYDNSGFGYRGHTLSNEIGHYSFKTVIPGSYPSRTPHIHIKIWTPGGRKLTTQLYFPDFSKNNNRDYLYNQQLEVFWKSETHAIFDFVLKSQ